MVSKGATTIWELWNGDTADPAMNSGNHVMLVGDLVIWFYQSLAGIAPDPARPGFQHLVMRPVLVGDLKYVDAEYHSIRGLIRSRWQRDAGGITWEVTIPANATATIYLPSAGAKAVTESGKPLEEATGLKIVKTAAGSTVVEAKAGSYRFAVKSK
jgi:alpha-L-rhamnosidase